MKIAGLSFETTVAWFWKKEMASSKESWYCKVIIFLGISNISRKSLSVNPSTQNPFSMSFLSWQPPVVGRHGQRRPQITARAAARRFQRGANNWVQHQPFTSPPRAFRTTPFKENTDVFWVELAGHQFFTREESVGNCSKRATFQQLAQLL